MTDSVRELCRAKLNLFLEVVGRRPDGSHDLVTVFHEIDLADELLASVATDRDTGVRLRVEGDAPSDDSNLAVRATLALLEDAGVEAAIDLELTKRIPVGGGLGGGSADAAGALRAVNRLLRLDYGDDGLERIAATLGSDVPFLVRGGTAVGRGRGEILEQVPTPPSMDFLLVVPDFSISTPAVYGALGDVPPTSREPDAVLQALAAGDADALTAAFHNALGPAAERVEPRLASFRHEAEPTVGCALLLTGSGSTLFAPGTHDAPDGIRAVPVSSR